MEKDDDVRRAHERVDDETSRVDTSEDETTTTTAGAPQSTSLEGEYIPQASDDSAELIVRKPDGVKATRDQDQESVTSASALSALRDHPDEDAGMKNPIRPSRDLADATGDDKHRSDAPTEPPDMPEGTRRRWGDERAETGVSEVSRGVERGPGDDGDEGRQPGMSDEPPDQPYGAPRNPDRVQVEPDVEPGGSAVHEDADARVNSMAEEAHSDVQFEAERSATCPNASIKGERGSTLAQGRSTTIVEENDQRTSPDVEDVPEDPPEPPPPLTSPDETARSQDEPPSVELEGERKGVASCDTGPTTGYADVAGVPGADEDPRN